MASERRVGLLDRQTRLSRSNSHYGVVQNAPMSNRERDGERGDRSQPTVVIRSFLLPDRGLKKVRVSSEDAKGPCIEEMSVEESLQFFDNTVAALDRNGTKQNYGSESDLISEFGYGSGYTELSATTDGEEHQAKQYGPGNRRRKSRQNRNQRLQNDPILGDLESDSTNDGQLFGSEVTPRVRTRTNSGQRRQRERRRQRRQNASRNSWTDSGLSLSKTDSQRSSHSDMSPIKRGRSKTTSACVGQVSEVYKVDARKETAPMSTSTALVKAQVDSGVSSPGPSIDSPVHMDSSQHENRGKVASEAGDAPRGSVKRKDDEKEQESRDTSYEAPCNKTEEEPLASSSLVNSLDSSSKSLNQFVFDIKPTNSKGVVNGTYTRKEKEILHQVFQNAQNSSQSVDASTPTPRGNASSKFPLPAHLDYPFCMYRQDEKKAKKSNGLMKGLRKLKEGITSKRNSVVSGSGEYRGKSHLHATEPEAMPPSRPVDKKKSLFKRIFKQSSDRVASKPRQTSAFRRDRFGSTRSFSGSVSQLFARGSRARSQSVENLKNCIRRGRDSFMKRSSSSVSLSAKMTRSSSVSSLMSRRNGFVRQNSMVSLAGNFSRTNNTSAFRRSDSVRSLHGGYDIATRVLQAREMPEGYYDDEDAGPQMVSHAVDYNVPLRGGWRPASRISRREQDFYDASSYYDENDYLNYNDCYAEEEPCACCYDESYYDYYDKSCYNEHYEPSFDHHPDQNDVYRSRVTLSNLDNRPVRHHMHRTPSYSSMYTPRGRPQSQVSSYYSPANARRDNRMVVAPLSVQVTQERRAERRNLATNVPVCDTMV